MCEPTTAAGVGIYTGMTNAALGMSVLTAASTAASIQGQRASQKAQAESQKQAMEANALAAAEQTEIARQDEAKATEASVRSLKDAELKSRQDKARIITAAGESGVSGNSVNVLLDDANRQMFSYQETKLRESQLNTIASSNRLKTSASNLVTTNKNVNRPIRGGSGLATLASGVSQGYSNTQLHKNL